MVGGVSGWWVGSVDGGWGQWMVGGVSGWWVGSVAGGWGQWLVGGVSGWWVGSVAGGWSHWQQEPPLHPPPHPDVCEELTLSVNSHCQ